MQHKIRKITNCNWIINTREESYSRLEYQNKIEWIDESNPSEWHLTSGRVRHNLPEQPTPRFCVSTFLLFFLRQIFSFKLFLILYFSFLCFKARPWSNLWTGPGPNKLGCTMGYFDMIGYFVWKLGGEGRKRFQGQRKGETYEEGRIVSYLVWEFIWRTKTKTPNLWNNKNDLGKDFGRLWRTIIHYPSLSSFILPQTLPFLTLKQTWRE